MYNISPIPTYAYGHDFRSRLEARWAVFLTHLRVPWTYEPEPVRISTPTHTYQYLPDFFLPTLALWLEIKPGHDLIAWHDHVKMAAFAEALPPTSTFRVMEGSPWLNGRHPDYASAAYHEGVLVQTRELWSRCRWCGRVCLTPPRTRCPVQHGWRWPFRISASSPAIRRAAQAARRDRFGW
jgi:hypothetical protein